MTGPELHLFSLNYKPVCFLSICSTPFSDLDRDSKALIFTKCALYLLFLLMFLLLYHPLPIPISFSPLQAFGGLQRGPRASFSLPLPSSHSESPNEMLMQHPSYFIEKFHARVGTSQGTAAQNVSCNCHVFSLKDWRTCMCAFLRKKTKTSTLALVNKESKCP